LDLDSTEGVGILSVGGLGVEVNCGVGIDLGVASGIIGISDFGICSSLGIVFPDILTMLWTLGWELSQPVAIKARHRNAAASMDFIMNCYLYKTSILFLLNFI
jgi:hypothetical protein